MMRKITDFIVEKRYFVFVFFLILTAVSCFLLDDIHVNYDMAKYLPKSSETRKGFDIMEDEFSNVESSSLAIMVKDLEDSEKQEALSYLQKIDHVSSVEYENTEEYNKGKYTLYLLTLDKSADSKEATKVYEEVGDYFGTSLVDTALDVSDQNKTVLPFYIIAIAVGSAILILIIMCESYLEPFLFFFTIFLAVILNNATNAFFPSVSNVTNSICAILQMALSMDYSIMLMNRYRQEKETEKDKVQAMKNALHHSFSSISSSSVTTIAGLLALVFMSFTIGRDLGYVLAKGVLFSLLTIFTCLPGLILMFDSLITKTKKKSPIIELKFFSKIAYHGRYVITILFLIVFVISYFLKGSLGILYADQKSQKIESTFSLNNQMAIIYPKEEEEKIRNYCQELEKEENVKDVLCYGNTIDLPLTYMDLDQKLKDLGSDYDIEEYLYKIIYYHYYRNQEDNRATLEDLLSFIKKNVYDNEWMNQDIDDTMKKDIDRLSLFSNQKDLSLLRNKSELADILNIDESKVDQLLIYYHSKKTNTKLTMKQFVDFMNRNIIPSEEYGSSVDKKTQNSLLKVQKFLDSKTIRQEITASQMSSLLGIPKEDVESLYLYATLLGDVNEKMTLAQFVQLVDKVAATNPTYAAMLESMKDQFAILRTFTNETIIQTPMDSVSLGKLLNIDPDTMNLLCELFLGSKKDEPISPYDFTKTLLTYQSILPSQMDISSLIQLQAIMDSTLAHQTYSYQELSTMLSISPDLTKQIYSVSIASNKKMSPYDFTTFLLSHQNDAELKGALDKNSITELTLLKSVMDGVLKNKSYSKEELSKLFSMDVDTLGLLYSLYDRDILKQEVKVNLKDFVNFLLQDVMKQEEYKKNFDETSKKRLEIISIVIQNTLANKKYDKEELYTLLSPLSKSLEKNMIDLVYIYYGSVQEFDDSWTMTVEEFVRYLNEDILKDTRFEKYIDADRKEAITDAKETILDAKEMLLGNSYSRMVLNTSFEVESKETFEFIKKVEDSLPKDDVYLIGDSPMAYEMDQTFQDELNFITILTMAFIFVVVAITFKSILIPIILVLLIQCAVFVTMGILSFGGSVYFISILIVQSILMGATIDYAILYTSYYLEFRKTYDKKESIRLAYQNSSHTILTSASVFIIVTLIVGLFASAVTAKICKTLSEGTICSAILIITLLPSILSTFDKWIVKKKK